MRGLVWEAGGQVEDGLPTLSDWADGKGGMCEVPKTTCQKLHKLEGVAQWQFHRGTEQGVRWGMAAGLGWRTSFSWHLYF